MSARPVSDGVHHGALAGGPERLSDFLISSAGEIAAMLKTLADGNVTLHLNAANGSAVAVTLQSVDLARGVLSFSVAAEDLQLDDVIEADEAVAVAYLDSIKLQFDVHDLVLVHGPQSAALNCSYPVQLYRFQRRHAFRVRPLVRATPVATLRHPMIPDMKLGLRVLDVSIGGCALLLPDDVPAIQPGVLINNVQFELDAETRLTASLKVQHVTSINPELKGVRLGCEMQGTQSAALRSLQMYVDQTQKRRRLMVLE